MDGAVWGAVAIIVAAAISGATAWASTRAGHRIDEEQTDTQKELAEFEILRGVVAALSDETDRLQEKLTEANADAERLRKELRAALTNLEILASHIRRYIPEKPFPELMPMQRLGEH